MARLLTLILVLLGWFLGFATLGIAWGQTGNPATSVTMPAAGGAFMVNLGDLTFPGAVFLGFWMLARGLPGAIRTWTPTLRIELLHRDCPPGEQSN